MDWQIQLFSLKLLFNLALLVGLSSVSGLIDDSRLRWPWLKSVLLGLVFGGAAIAGMLNPLVLGPGLIFDGRSVMIGLCAMFYGPLAGGIAAALPLVLRLHLGGVGVSVGIASILLALIVGLAAWRRYLAVNRLPSIRAIYGYGLALHLGIVALLVLLPGRMFAQVIAGVGLPIIILYPLAMVIGGKLLADRLGLKNSEQNYRQLFDEHAAVKLLIDPDTGRIVNANQAAANFYGWRKEELVKKRIQEINTLSPEEIAVEIKKARERKRHHFEFRHCLADGSIRDVAVFSSTTKVDNRELLHSIILDISEQKKVEQEQDRLREALLQARKMETVGRLAGGIAHEFNNMMTVVLVNARILSERMGPGNPGESEIGAICQAAGRAAELTRQLTVFSRKQMIRPRLLDLNLEVERCLPDLRKLLMESQSLDWQPGPDLKPVLIDPLQVARLLEALTLNAVDAIGSDGTIRLRTNQVTLDSAFCEAHPGARPGSHLLLEISDNGRGMDRQTLAQIFEPFFTTKDFGEGVGLGLATVYGIVKQNQGFIKVSSNPGEGTSVRIYLPGEGEPGRG